MIAIYTKYAILEITPKVLLIDYLIVILKPFESSSSFQRPSCCTAMFLQLPRMDKLNTFLSGNNASCKGTVKRGIQLQHALLHIAKSNIFDLLNANL